jgi:hypothetical protein
VTSLLTLQEVAPWVELEKLSAPELVERTRALRQLHLRQARGEEIVGFPDAVVGASAFIEYAMPDEESGDSIENADYHEEWQAFFDRNRYGVIMAPVGHGKTQQIVGRILYHLGKNPNARIAIICATDGQAMDRLAQVQAHILHNPRVREVFPHLVPKKGAKWNAHECTVARTTIAKDPSVAAYGAGSKAITGARLDVVVLDDVLDMENTSSPEQRAKTLSWFDTKVFTRKGPRGRKSRAQGDKTRFRVWCIGTPWHEEDLLHTLGSRPAWGMQVWSAVLNPEAPEDRWEALWPEAIPVEELREDAANMTPSAFARKRLCKPYSDASSRFQEAWIRACLAQGLGRGFLDEAPTAFWGGPLLPCYTGVDLGVGQDEDSDLTVLFTIAILPDRRYLVVNVESGRWQGPEIVQRIVQHHIRYQSTVVVESVAAQAFIAQFAQGRGVPVIPFSTTSTGKRGKHSEDFGVETMAVEMRATRWVIPATQGGEPANDEIRAWIREMRGYTPKSHTGDRLMASWFAREEARIYIEGLEAGDGEQDPRQADPLFR